MHGFWEGGSVGFIALTLLKVESFTTSGIIFYVLK